MNGGDGWDTDSLVSMPATANEACSRASNTFRASCSLDARNASSLTRTSSALKAWCSASHRWICSDEASAFPSRTLVSSCQEARRSAPRSAVKMAGFSQYSSGLNCRICRSRSTIILTATDWTRPADRPRVTFFQRRGLI